MILARQTVYLGETRKIRRLSSKTGRVQKCSVVDPESVFKRFVPEKLSRGRQPEIIILREYRARLDWHAIEMHESICESVCWTPADSRRSRNWLRFLSSTGILFTRRSFRPIARCGSYSPWFSLGGSLETPAGAGLRCPSDVKLRPLCQMSSLSIPRLLCLPTGNLSNLSNQRRNFLRYRTVFLGKISESLRIFGVKFPPWFRRNFFYRETLSLVKISGNN